MELGQTQYRFTHICMEQNQLKLTLTCQNSQHIDNTPYCKRGTHLVDEVYNAVQKIFALRLLSKVSMSKRDQAIITQLYRLWYTSLRGGDDLPIVCGEHGPKMDGMPRYSKD